MLAVYTLFDLVSNHLKYFVINFGQVHYQVFLFGNVYSIFCDITSFSSPPSLKVVVFKIVGKSKSRKFFMESFRYNVNLSFLISLNF